jgi:hypothetical protein
MAWLDDSGSPAAWDAAIQLRNLPDDEMFEWAGRKMTAGEWRHESKLLGVEKGSFGASEVMETTRREVIRSERTKGFMGKVLHPVDTLSDFGGKAGSTIEDTSRMGVHFANLEKGMSPDAAARQVDRVLYNYSSEALTKTERTWLKRAFPFYSWMRANIPRMLEMMVKNGGKMGVMNKVRNSAFGSSEIDPDKIPQYLEDQYAMPIPGTDIMLTPGLPFQDLSLFGDASRPVSAASPLIKGIFEGAANKDIFSGNSIERYPGGLNRAPGYVQATDRALAGVAPWDALKGAMGMEYRTDVDGRESVSMRPADAQFLKTVAPFGERIGRGLLDPGGTNPAAKTNDQLYYFSGIKTSPIDEKRMQEQYMALRAKQLADRARVLRDQGVIR